MIPVKLLDSRYVSRLVAWAQRRFMPLRITLPSSRPYGVPGAVLQPVRIPARLVARHRRGQASFFVSEL